MARDGRGERNIPGREDLMTFVTVASPVDAQTGAITWYRRSGGVVEPSYSTLSPPVGTGMVSYLRAGVPPAVPV